MGLRLLLGEAAGGKTTALMEEIKGVLEGKKDPRLPLVHNGRIYVITPEQMSLKTEELILSYLQKDALFQVEVLSFKRLAYTIFQEVGEPKRVPLDDVGKSMVLYRILKEHQSELVYYGRSISQMGFIDQLKLMITEMIQYRLDEAALDQLIVSQHPNSILQLKLKDMRLILHYFLEAMEETREEPLIASEMVLDAFVEKIPLSQKLKDAYIYLDGFTGFTPQQYRLIKALLGKAAFVGVTLSLPRYAYDHAMKFQKWMDLPRNLFFTPCKTVVKLTGLSRDLRLPLSVEWKETKADSREEELSFVTRNLCQMKEIHYDKKARLVLGFQAKSMQEEVREVMHRILHLVREEGVQYRDIAIILTDMAGYGPLIKRSAFLYDMPLFLDEKTDVTLNPYVQFLDSVLALLETGFSRDAFLTMIKTGFTCLSDEECDLLENEVIRKNWMGRRIIVENLRQMEEEKGPFTTLADALESLYHEFFGSVASMTGALRGFANKLHVQEKLEADSQFLKDRGNLLLAMQFERIYDAADEVMEQLTAILEGTPVSKEEYTSMLRIGMKQLKLGMLPSSLDEVFVGDIRRSRLTHVDHLFILGINGGSFPAAHGQGGLLSEAERTKAGSILEMAQGEREDLMEQYYGMYTTLGKAGKSIFLSSSMTGLKGEALGESPLWKRVTTVLGEGWQKPPLDEITLVRPYLYELDHEALANNPLLSLIREKTEESALVTAMAEGYDLHEEEKILSPYLARRLMNVNQRLLSVTQLEKYAECPYAYFLRYGLHLEERERPQVRQLEDGTVLHDLLYDAGEYLSRALSEEEASSLAEDLFSKKEKKYEVYQSSGRFKYYWQKLQDTAAKSLQAISAQASLSDFRHAAFEWSFGQEKDSAKPMIVRLKDGSEVRLTGKIDRVDLWKEEDDSYISIIDYKSGSTKYEYSRLYAGVQIQLPVYMKKSRESFQAKPAGYFYFHLMPSLESEKPNELDPTEEELRIERLKEARLDGAFLNDPEVAAHMDQGLQEGSGLVLKADLNKDGSFRKSTKALSMDQFNIVEEFVEKKIQEAAEGIKAGKIRRSPLTFSKDASSCSYCEFRHACPYDAELPGAYTRRMRTMNSEDFFNEVTE